MKDVLIRDFEQITQYIPDKKSLYKTKWLITGVTGMIGSYLLSFLSWLNEKELNKTMSIVATHRSDIDASHPNIGILLEKEFIEFRKIDLNTGFNFEDNDNFNFVLHCASNASPKTYLADPISTINANVKATQDMLEYFKNQKEFRTFIYFSSGEIYGEPNTIPTPEEYIGTTNHLSSRACYVESKKFTETLCWNYYKQYKLPVKIIRPVHAYGPGFKKNDGRVWADFITKALAGENIIILGDGLSRRGFCYLADAVVQIFAVIQKGKNGETYNIGNEEHISIKDLAEVIKNIAIAKHKKRIDIQIKNSLPEHLKGSPQVSCPAVQKVKKLSLCLATNLNNGLEKTMYWYSLQKNIKEFE